MGAAKQHDLENM